MVVRGIRYEPTITVLDEDGIPVAKLMCDNLNTIAVLQRLDGVGVTPVVEGRARQFEKGRSPQVLIEYSVVVYQWEERGVLGKVLRIIREHLPRPHFSRPDHAIPPGSFSSSGVEGA